MSIKETRRKAALFIGRFQPFHNGHLSIVKRVAARYKHIIIGIGSSQYSRTLENPFSLSERKQMITATLKEAGIMNWKLAGIPDIGDHARWVSWVESRTMPFDVVYTGNAFVASLFRKTGYTVHIVREIGNISATRIRQLMLRGNAWTRLVPPAVKQTITKIRRSELSSAFRPRFYAPRIDRRIFGIEKRRAKAQGFKPTPIFNKKEGA